VPVHVLLGAAAGAGQVELVLFVVLDCWVLKLPTAPSQEESDLVSAIIKRIIT